MRTSVQIVRYDTKQPVDAELFDEVTVEDFVETQEKWRPVVLEAAAGADQELVPRHFHWNWTTKEADLRVLAFTFFGIRCEKELQGVDEARDGRARGTAS